MKFKLSQILESTILLEGRREDVIKKYGEEHTGLVDMFVEIDPSGNNKYLEWMVKTVIQAPTKKLMWLLKLNVSMRTLIV